MKKANTKEDAAIIVIGNEILSGRTQDVNVSFLSKWLNDLGVKVVEVRIIEDKEESIVKSINEIKNKFKYILWLIGIVVWNFGVPSAKFAYDVIAALCLKHIVDLDNSFAR